MIVYKDNVLEMLKNKGFSTYKLRREKLLSEKYIQSIRQKHVTLYALDKLCYLLQCQPAQLIEYIPSAGSARKTYFLPLIGNNSFFGQYCHGSNYQVNNYVTSSNMLLTFIPDPYFQILGRIVPV